MNADAKKALNSIVMHHRAIADQIESLIKADGEIQISAPPTPWDPETDAPLVAPKVVGTDTEQDWCTLTYLGGIYAINRRQNRGATTDEVREYALKAGYQDGRAVTAWSKGNGATQNDDSRQRWVTSLGVNHWVKKTADRLGVRLPDDLADHWDAPDFRPRPSAG